MCLNQIVFFWNIYAAEVTPGVGKESLLLFHQLPLTIKKIFVEKFIHSVFLKMKGLVLQ